MNGAREPASRRCRDQAHRRAQKPARRIGRAGCRPPTSALAFLLLLLCPIRPGAAAETNRSLLRPEGHGERAVLKVAAPLALFNGSNLLGWHTWLVDSKRADPRHVFSVSSGMIHISGDGLGYLATESTFENYRLMVEFRWGRTNWSWADRIGRARDSGLFLHASGPDGNSHDGNGAFQAALECQLMEGAVGDILLIRGTDTDGSLLAPEVTLEAAKELDRDRWPTWRRGGERRRLQRWGRVNWAGKDPAWRDEFGFRGSHDVESKPGEWTRLECRCAARRIEIRVNGKLVNVVTEVFPQRGRILLQCEGSEIFFRRVELFPLAE